METILNFDAVVTLQLHNIPYSQQMVVIFTFPKFRMVFSAFFEDADK